MKKLMTADFLKGKRTYLLGFLVAAQAVTGYAAGDLTLVEFLDKVPEILGGLGLMSLRASVTSIRKPLLSEQKRAEIQKKLRQMIDEELDKAE